MRWKFGNMGAISIKNEMELLQYGINTFQHNLKDYLNLRNFETKRPRHQTPRIQGTKTLRNQESKKPKRQETFLCSTSPRTPQHTDSHPCTRPVLGRRGILGDTSGRGPSSTSCSRHTGLPTIFRHPTISQNMYSLCPHRANQPSVCISVN